MGPTVVVLKLGNTFSLDTFLQCISRSRAGAPQNQTFLICQCHLFPGCKPSSTPKVTTGNQREIEEDRIFDSPLEVYGTTEVKAEMGFVDNPELMNGQLGPADCWLCIENNV